MGDPVLVVARLRSEKAHARGARPGPGDDEPLATLRRGVARGPIAGEVATVHRDRLPRHDPDRVRRPGPLDGDRPRKRPRPGPRPGAVRRPTRRAAEDDARPGLRRAAGPVDRGEEGARCSGKLRSGPSAGTPNGSGSATSLTCSPTPPAVPT